MVEVSELLERIKNGNISKYIKEVYEIEEMGLSENKKKVLFKVIDFNRKGKFPTVLDLCESYPHITLNHLNYLKEKELVLDFTIIELVMFFGSYKNFKPFLPFSLNYATNFELEKISGGSTSKSWEKKIKNPRASRYKRFYIALVSENKNPVFSKAFEFLKNYTP